MKKISVFSSGAKLELVGGGGGGGGRRGGVFEVKVLDWTVEQCWFINNAVTYKYDEYA